MVLSLGEWNRVRKIAQVFVRHGLSGLVDQLGLSDRPSYPAERDERVMARLGNRLCRVLNDLGPTFVKLGQVLSTREDLLPAPVTKKLSALQDQVDPIPARVAKRVVSDALGRPIDDCFRSFVDTPLAAGSIAQVHRAQDKQGREVVVKIRRPQIEQAVESDLALLSSVAQIAAERSPSIARYDPIGFVDEFARNLRIELDFDREAEVLEQLRQQLGRTAEVPTVHRSLSCTSVLTMDYLAGVKLTAVTDVELRRQLAKQVITCFANQYLLGPLFHADPHGGNLLRRPDGALALFDLGAHGRVSKDMRRAILKLGVAIMARRGYAIADCALPMLWAPPDFDVALYRQQLGKLVGELVSRPLAKSDMASLIRPVYDIIQQHGLRLQTDYYLLLRSAMLIDALLRSLDPELNPAGAIRSYVLRSCYRPRWSALAGWLVLGTVYARAAQVLASRRRRIAFGLVMAIVVTIAFALGWWSCRAEPQSVGYEAPCSQNRKA